MEATEKKDEEKEVTVTNVKTLKVTDSMYKAVSNDLKALSRSVQESDKAAQAHRASMRISEFSEKNPASEKQQHQIYQFLRAKEQLLAKERNKDKELEHER